MFSRSKDKGKKKQTARQTPNSSLAQFGLLDIPNVSDLSFDQNDDDGIDENLEAELLALMQGNNVKPVKKKEPRIVVSSKELDKMVTSCMIDDSDDEIDENDPELLAELSALGIGGPSPPKIPKIAVPQPTNAPSIVQPSPFVAGQSIINTLKERIQMYKDAEKNALDADENSRAKRFTRGLRTLNRMLKDAQAGKPIDETEIPPTVLVKSPSAASFNDLDKHSKSSVQTNDFPSTQKLPVQTGVLSNKDETFDRPSEYFSTHEILKPSTPSTLSQNVVFGSGVNSASSQNTSQLSPLSVAQNNNNNNDSTVNTAQTPFPNLLDSNVPISQSIDILLPSVPNTNLSHTDTTLSQNDKNNSHNVPQNIALNSSNFVDNSKKSTSLPISPPKRSDSDPLAKVLQLHEQYKVAALTAKKSGDKESAISHMRTMKQLEPMIQDLKEGKSVDVSSLHPVPGALPTSLTQPISASSVQKFPNEISEKSLSQTQNVLQGQGSDSQNLTPGSNGQNPTSIVEALEQRLEVYIQHRDKAKNEGNARKERMNQRITKQYQDALRTHKMGRAVDFSELPTPPGFPPIPAGLGTGSGVSPSSSTTLSPEKTALTPENKAPAKENVPASNPASVGGVVIQGPPQKNLSPTSKPQPPQKVNVRKAPQSRVERQLSVLKKRQDQFKMAALEAKKRGEIEQAKEYLRNFKGFDTLIEASNSGLPVDMNTVPIPPQEAQETGNVGVDFELISKEDCVTSPPDTDVEISLAFNKLEEDLIAQIKMCAETREHFKALGDVASSNRFQQLILNTKKDLDALRVACKRGDKPPRFHYENRTFTIIQCNTDLNDSDCEVTVVRGINFNVPESTEFDSCVKVDFPYPIEANPVEKTGVVKGTNNPEFNHRVVFSIDRKGRALSRVFKRQSVKCQVLSKGGWFHRDSVFGSIKIPLISLENKCTLHDSFDLTDDKKKMIGGKLEVKIRLRNPIVSKQLEKVTEKWVVIDGF